jgi:DNA-binding NtrC family response regulator
LLTEVRQADVEIAFDKAATMRTVFNHILVVDDDPIIRQVLAIFFASKDYRVSTAVNGAEAMQQLDEHRDIDLVISDLHMPGVNGVEFLGHLHDARRQLPVIVVTSADKCTVNGASAMAEALQINLIGVFTKPIDFDGLAALLGICDQVVDAVA